MAVIALRRKLSLMKYRLWGLCPDPARRFVRQIYYLSLWDPFKRLAHKKVLARRFTSASIEESENYLRLHLFCESRRFLEHLNLDSHDSSETDFVCDLSDLPLPDSSVQSIEIINSKRLNEKILKLALPNWYRKLIPEGKLMIEVPVESSIDLRKLASDAKFSEISTTISICNLDHRRFEARKISVESIAGESALCHTVGDLPTSSLWINFETVTGISLHDKKQRVVCDNLNRISWSEGIEHLQKLQVDGHELLLVAEKGPGDGDFRTVFTKGLLAEMIDTAGLSLVQMDSIEHESATKIVAFADGEKPEIPERSERICAIGGFRYNGYNQLGFHPDGQARAFRALGFNPLFIDYSLGECFARTRERILDHRPDILWVVRGDGIELLRKMANDIKDLRRKGTQVIYWFVDARHPAREDLSEIVDLFFITNEGQIPEYKKAHGFKRAYYMPQAVTPAFMHRLNLPVRWDFGFTGSVTGPYHTRRERILTSLAQEVDLKIVDSVRNNISEFYSQCRGVVGINPNIISHLYTSNRFFVAMGCGAFYLAEWFSGVERLATEGEHLVTFKTEDEMIEKAKKYLNEPDEMKRIGQNAQHLMHDKHTYTKRLTNMFDILQGRSQGFEGFIR